MSSYWFKNFVGVKQSDLELLRVPNPGTEFCIHVTMRTIQTGALLGSILGPVSVLLFKEKNKSLQQAFVEGGTNGAVYGAIAGPIVTYLSLRNMNSIQLYDKCYRLRFDNNQLWQDRMSVISATVGYLSSGNVGMVVGLDLALVLSNILGGAWK